MWFESKIAPVINGNPQQKHLVIQKKMSIIREKPVCRPNEMGWQMNKARQESTTLSKPSDFV